MTVNSDFLQVTIDQLGSPTLLVLGDLMLDRYSFGAVERVSPEAPVPVLRAERDEDRLGGAAAVACLAAALGGQIRSIGIVGCDPDGVTLATQLADMAIDPSGVLTCADRPTTLKQRYLSDRHGHAQLLRVDRESTRPLQPSTEEQLVAACRAGMTGCDVLLVADYGKGVCSQSVLRTIIDSAHRQGIPVFIDPCRRTDYSIYQGASLLLPNRTEAEVWCDQPITSLQIALEVAQRMCEATSAGGLLLKLDRDGMVLARPGEAAIHYPTQPRAVFDVTGAGDSVLAAMGLAVGSGVPFPTAACLANLVAGLQVQRLGVQPVTTSDLRCALVPPAERLFQQHPSPDSRTGAKWLTLPGIRALAEEARSSGRRVVFTNGCFAALHAGHLAYLEESRGLGDFLVVAINSAASIRRLKGDRPIIPDARRAAMLAALDFVDAIVVFDEDTPHNLLRAIRPDTLVKGGTTDIIVGAEIVQAYGGRVVKLGATDGISTSQLLGHPG